jgi:serine/threonine protein kinase
MARQSDQLIGQQLGNYRLIKQLGEGGDATVYLGEHIYLKTQAAIKVLHVHLNPDAIQDFLAESRTIAHLKHPNIVRVLDYSIEERAPFLVMEYLPLGSLRRRHPKGSRLPLAAVTSYVEQIASALAHAHAYKLIHRDVKPENILVHQDGHLLLTDFGLVMLAQTSSSFDVTSHIAAGTLGYMAPEQFHGKPRLASDQYALGIIAHEWLSGERPFKGTTLEIATQHMLAPIPSLHETRPDLPPAVEQVIGKALAKEPEQRYPNVMDFALALKLASEGKDIPAEMIHPDQAVQPDAVDAGLLQEIVATARMPQPDPITPLPQSDSISEINTASFHNAATPEQDQDAPQEINTHNKRLIQRRRALLISLMIAAFVLLNVVALLSVLVFSKTNTSASQPQATRLATGTAVAGNSSGGVITSSPVASVTSTAGATSTPQIQATATTVPGGNPGTPVQIENPGAPATTGGSTPPAGSTTAPTATASPACIAQPAEGATFGGTLAVGGNPPPQTFAVASCSGSSQAWYIDVDKDPAAFVVTLSPASGTLSPNGQISVTATFQCNTLIVGLYSKRATVHMGQAAVHITFTCNVLLNLSQAPATPSTLLMGLGCCCMLEAGSNFRLRFARLREKLQCNSSNLRRLTNSSNLWTG